MIRVLQVVGGLSRGGTESVVMNFYRQIDRTKVQFDFISHHPELKDYEQEIINLGGKIYYVPQYAGVNTKSYISAWEELFQNHPEYRIIHGQVWSTAGIYLRIAKRYGLYTIAHSHSVSARKGIPGIGRLLLKNAFPIKADYYMACSNASAKWLFGNKIFGKGNFSILPNAIDVSNYCYCEDVRNEVRYNNGVKEKTVVGHVGIFDSNKNQEFIIELFHIFHTINHESVLWLIGNGPYMKRVKEKAKKYGDPVVFWGVCDNVAELLQGMDLFLFPSHFESFGNAALEAQASGLRVICSDSIPIEVAVTDRITFVSLKKPKEWIKYMLETDTGSRFSVYSHLKGSKYDVEVTAAWLQNYYLNCNRDMVK